MTVYDLAVAAGRFSDEQQVGTGLPEEAASHPEHFEWAELPDYYRPRPDLFVVQVVGESMNRVIPDGGWGLFRARGRERSSWSSSAKSRTREKAPAGDGSWRHSRIVLRPDTDREGYEPIVLEPEQEGEVRVVAELLGAL